MNFLVIMFIMPNAISQQTPNSPVSYRLFNPFVFNPAIAGSKDYMAVDLTISNTGDLSSQIVSGNMRLSKTTKEYFSSLDIPEFTNFGLGGYLYNDVSELNRNRGFGAAGSYHLGLGKDALSFLSVGLAAKFTFNHFTGDPDLSLPDADSFFPNLDAGIYYYHPAFYAGISGTNILGTQGQSDSVSYSINITRQYFLTTGYKIIINRSINLIAEPFLIVNSGDSLPEDLTEILNPGIKLYAGNFCTGTYFNDFSRFSFFMHYKYNKIHLGAYVEWAYNSAYYRNPLTIEFSFGLNLSAMKSGYIRRNHW